MLVFTCGVYLFTFCAYFLAKTLGNRELSIELYSKLLIENNMSSAKSFKPVVIDLNIGDQLTSISCGHIVVELLKFIAYQRQQIPYTYPWLKQVVNKRKLSEHEDIKESFHSERHFRVASAALENMDFVLKSLLQEINGSSIPDEVCIALGATPVSFKEVYRLVLPTMCHKPQCHSDLIASDQKIQRNVFRSLAEKLSQFFFTQLQPTNMYIFIKKKLNSNQECILSSDNFEHTSGCRIPRTSKIAVIDFRTQNNDTVTCCNDFKIFGDVCEVERRVEDINEEFQEIESTDTAHWYQSSYVIKGFKDCVVNGSSVTNTWMNTD